MQAGIFDPFVQLSICKTDVAITTKAFESVYNHAFIKCGYLVFAFRCQQIAASTDKFLNLAEKLKENYNKIMNDAIIDLILQNIWLLC